MYIRDLSEENDDRLEQAARAILAAVYDPLTTQASWADMNQLNRPSFERLMKITALAVANWKAHTDPGDVPARDVHEIEHRHFNPTAKLLALNTPN